jgi:hypothetical protein
MRRKGERKLTRTWPEWGPKHPVARDVSTGGHWLDAWTAQASTPWEKLSRTSGLSIERIRAISQGDRLTRSELDGLAAAWKVDPAQVEASLGDPLLLVG